jgi:23S rRNA (cytidine1920-2'-O)/16S rRNA (cytidine1409-2'-O)-methyltransferase
MCRSFLCTTSSRALSILTPDADIVALVKPQFEAGRHEVGKGGVITIRDS